MPITLPAEARAALDRLIAQHGTADEAAAVLYDDNFRHRQRLAGLKEQLEDKDAEITSLRGKIEKSGKGVKDGEVVLSAEDAKTWKELQELGLKPAEIKKQLEEGGKSAKELAEVREAEREAAVATAAGYKPGVLRTLTRDKGLYVELREVDVTTDGKTEKKKVAYVRKVTDAKEAGEPLQAYAERELKDYLPALKQGGSEEEEELGPEGIQVPEQIPASGKASGKVNPVKAYIDQKYGKKSDART
jgi:hypothetical protein